MSFKRFTYFIAVIGLIAALSCDNNEDPVTVSTADLTITVDENPSNAQILGTVTGTTNQGSVTFSIASQAPVGAIAIDSSTGELTVADATQFDFETNPSITATVTVANGAVSETANVTINLNNMGDAVTLADETISMDENPSNAQIISTLTATVDSGTASYSISSQTPAGAFALDATSGELTVLDATLIDFETSPTLTVVVTATNGTASDDGTITVNLNNVLEEVVTQDETVTIDENPASGRAIVTVTGTTDMGSVTFSLASESATGAFSLDASSGELTVGDAALFDYEQNTSLMATVNVVNGSISETALITVNLNDLLEISWTEENMNAAFGGVYGHRIVNFNGALIMIGGIRDVNRINEVWASANGSTWTQVSTVGNIFTARNGHQVVVFNNKMWVIGGFTDGGRSSEVWSSSDGATWTLETTSALFSPRADHAAVVFNNKIYVVGGSDGTMKNDVWSSSDGINWTEETISGSLFSARQAHSLTVFNGQMYLIAGADLDGQQLLRQRNDIWTSSDGITWTEVSVTGNQFLERWIHGAIVHKNLLWVIGGDDNTSARFNDVWTSPDGATWTQQTSSPIFDVRDQIGIFIFNNRLWISGGSNNDGILTDIWATNN